MAGESGLEAAAVGAAALAGTPPLGQYAPESDRAAPATEPWSASRAATALWRELHQRPFDFEFYQAVRLLERMNPERTPVGGFADPRQEVVRFRTAAGVAFPASELRRLDPPREGEQAPERMTVNFLGLTGPQGLLPLVYSMHVTERERAGDRGLKEFLGIFEHRALSLLYRAWQRSRAEIAVERRQRTGAVADDWLARHLLELLGLGVEELRARLPIAENALLHYAGLLALPTRPAAALEQLVADAFDVSVEVQQFVGAWYPLTESDQCAVGEETASAQLGGGAVVGDEIWDQQSRVRLRIGPLPRARYERFLPGGDAYQALRGLTRFFGGEQVEFEVQLVLAREDVPACRLGGDEEAGATPLGWSTWLRTRAPERDPDDAIFTL